MNTKQIGIRDCIECVRGKSSDKMSWQKGAVGYLQKSFRKGLVISMLGIVQIIYTSNKKVWQ